MPWETGASAGQQKGCGMSVAKGMEIKPNDAKAHYYLGIAYNKKDAVDEAISELQKAIAIDPTDGRSYYFLGVAYDKKGLARQAKEAYRKSEKLFGNSP